MQLCAVPPERVGEFWSLARDHVYAAMDRGGGLRSARDVEFDVLTGHAILWLVVDESRAIGAVVTQIYAEGSCWIVAYGCEDHDRAAHLLPVIEQFARNEGCTSVRLCGRKGWERVLAGYRPTAVILEKELP